MKKRKRYWINGLPSSKRTATVVALLHRKYLRRCRQKKQHVTCRSKMSSAFYCATTLRPLCRWSSKVPRKTRTRARNQFPAVSALNLVSTGIEKEKDDEV